jgi:hypothetical protein
MDVCTFITSESGSSRDVIGFEHVSMRWIFGSDTFLVLIPSSWSFVLPDTLDIRIYFHRADDQ